MRTIRVDDATFERLKRWAEPLEDSPADALRKLLDYAERMKRRDEPLEDSPTDALRKALLAAEGRRGRRLPKGAKLPQSEYYRPLLESVYELGGKGRMSEVLALVERKLQPFFREADTQPLNSGGDLRWRNTAQWARYDLVKRGLLRGDSPRGVWELTDAGVRVVEGQDPTAYSSMPSTS